MPELPKRGHSAKARLATGELNDHLGRTLLLSNPMSFSASAPVIFRVSLLTRRRCLRLRRSSCCSSQAGRRLALLLRQCATSPQLSLGQTRLIISVFALSSRPCSGRLHTDVLVRRRRVLQPSAACVWLRSASSSTNASILSVLVRCTSGGRAQATCDRPVWGLALRRDAASSTAAAAAGSHDFDVWWLRWAWGLAAAAAGPVRQPTWPEHVKRWRLQRKRELSAVGQHCHQEGGHDGRAAHRVDQVVVGSDLAGVPLSGQSPSKLICLKPASAHAAILLSSLTFTTPSSRTRCSITAGRRTRRTTPPGSRPSARTRTLPGQ